MCEYWYIYLVHKVKLIWHKNRYYLIGDFVPSEKLKKMLPCVFCSKSCRTLPRSFVRLFLVWTSVAKCEIVSPSLPTTWSLPVLISSLRSPWTSELGTPCRNRSNWPLKSPPTLRKLLPGMCVYIHVHTCTCMCMSDRVSEQACVCACVHVYICVCTTLVYSDVCMCVHTCTCIYM